MRLLIVLLTSVLACAPRAHAQAASPSRGELLYTTHCIACHSTQMHWRDKRIATDWKTLRAQVQRWQAAASLAWAEDDVDQVTRHLSDTIYHFPRPEAAQRTVSSGIPAPAN